MSTAEGTAVFVPSTVLIFPSTELPRRANKWRLQMAKVAFDAQKRVECMLAGLRSSRCSSSSTKECPTSSSPKKSD